MGSENLQHLQRSKVVVASRIVAPPEPEVPGLSSVVHVKPREFAPAEKQANKHLILKGLFSEVISFFFKMEYNVVLGVTVGLSFSRQ